MRFLYIYGQQEILNDVVILDHFQHIKSGTPEDQQSQAVKDLIYRLIPRQTNDFIVIVNASYFQRKFLLDSFELRSLPNGKIQITAKFWCRSWCRV